MAVGQERDAARGLEAGGGGVPEMLGHGRESGREDIMAGVRCGAEKMGGKGNTDGGEVRASHWSNSEPRATGVSSG
jgi:hypothetical protein